MALTDIKLCSRALLSLGADTIASFNEGTAEAEVAANLYPSTRDAMLSAYPWSFATGQVVLNKYTPSPVADYAYAYQLPADFLRALSVGAGTTAETGAGRGVDYRIYEDRIHTDTDGVILSYIFRPNESAFPPFFDQAMIAHLAAEFATPITESTSRAEATFRNAEVEFRRAKVIDAQQQTPQRIEDFTLIDVRG